MTPLLAAILTGLVVDQTGAYIPNATVQYLPGRTVQTDMTGRFTTPKLPAGIYGLRISAPGFLIGRINPMPMTEDDVKEIPPITLRIGYKNSAFYCGMKFANPRYIHKPAPESSLRGIITAPATITLTGGPRDHTIEAEGMFRFDGISPGTYTLRATSPEYPTFEIRTVKIPAKTAVEIDGWIDPPETRKTLQHFKSDAICL